MNKYLLLIAAIVSWLATCPAEAQETAKKPPSSKTAVRFAIGDIHGDYVSFIKLLGKLGLVDSKLSWSGGRKELIQTGDIFDRGPGLLRLAFELHEELDGGAGAGLSGQDRGVESRPRRGSGWGLCGDEGLSRSGGRAGTQGREDRHRTI